MVHLFVPTGEGQHPAIPQLPEPYRISAIVADARLSTVLAGGLLITRLILRRPLPASMPSKTAYWLTRSGMVSALMLPVSALTPYTENALASSVMQYEGIQGTQFRWWERSNSWTADDGLLLGAIGGSLLTRRMPFLQCLSSINRLFARWGVACAGGAVGSKFTQSFGDFRIEKAEFIQLQRERERLSELRYEALRTMGADPDFVPSLDRSARSRFDSYIRRHGR